MRNVKSKPQKIVHSYLFLAMSVNTMPDQLPSLNEQLKIVLKSVGLPPQITMLAIKMMMASMKEKPLPTREEIRELYETLLADPSILVSYTFLIGGLSSLYQTQVAIMDGYVPDEASMQKIMKQADAADKLGKDEEVPRYFQG